MPSRTVRCIVAGLRAGLTAGRPVSDRPWRKPMSDGSAAHKALSAPPCYLRLARTNTVQCVRCIATGGPGRIGSHVLERNPWLSSPVSWRSLSPRPRPSFQRHPSLVPVVLSDIYAMLGRCLCAHETTVRLGIRGHRPRFALINHTTACIPTCMATTACDPILA
ncbi:hypothetical protein T440DRAFT_322804 [Plenodomus tracheiphilus IPT5]|uniref:Uncharacterized protein n=1 Tax=Plenodomus tracheiphilus IPT5 TaxID=1408161 RepID=A0A6A7BFM6_9PLEO|nr:hypothetical protein T440DRAFT_322804 [Plenodomus tracheiphilus IPT5]